MAAAQEQEEHNFEKVLSSYLGISFTIFLGLLPENSIGLVSKLQTHNKDLTFKLKKAEEQLRQLHSRRKEDSKANARVVEIFASHRHSWQQEEKRLLQQIDEGNEEIVHLRGKVEELEKMESELRDCVEDLKKEICERDEMLNFLSSNTKTFEMGNNYSGSGDGGTDGGGDCYSEIGLRYGKVEVPEEMEFGSDNGFLKSGIHKMEELRGIYGQSHGFSSEFSNSASKFRDQRETFLQDVQYEPEEQLYHLKRFVSRRESPWKVDGESTGVSTKLKLLEQELLNLERVGKTDLSNVPSLLTKQAKRYQALAGKIDDLCRSLQASDPCESTLSSEFRAQRQTEFLLEAFRLQQRASETSQKLLALQSETVKSSFGSDLEGQAKLGTRRSFDSIKNNFKEIQRNLEIRLARIIGDLEGILSRDGASRVREYYVSRYPFVQ